MDLIFIFAIASVLTVWFKSSVVVEYCTFLAIVDSYKKAKMSNPGLEFIDYITIYRNCFLSRLIVCPYCINVWLTLPCMFFVPIYELPVIYISSLILYKLV